MALIAKKVLTIGFVTAALPGTVVAPEAVDQYGWHDDVEDDGRVVYGEPTPPPEPAPAKKK